MADARLARWVVVVISALVLGTAGSSGLAAEMAQTPGATCTGMSQYRNEMMAAGRTWVKGMRSDGLLGVSTQSFDENQWLTYGARAKTLLNDLRAIDPPAFAASWHNSQTDTARLRQNFAVWATVIGFEATAEFYGPRVASIKAETVEGRDTATAICGRFANLVDEWNRLGQTATGSAG